MKIHQHFAGHMTKMAAMPIHGKTLKILFPGTNGQISMKLYINSIEASEYQALYYVYTLG